jgi:hypothetical protein
MLLRIVAGNGLLKVFSGTAYFPQMEQGAPNCPMRNQDS